MKVYEVPLTFAEHHIDILGPSYQVSVYRTIGPLVLNSGVMTSFPHNLFWSYNLILESQNQNF